MEEKIRTIHDVRNEQHARVEEMATLKSGSWSCNKCNSEIQQTTGYASVHDGPGNMSGGGTVLHYPVPYCPKCEGKPETPHDIVDTDN